MVITEPAIRHTAIDCQFLIAAISETNSKKLMGRMSAAAHFLGGPKHAAASQSQTSLRSGPTWSVNYFAE